MTSALATRIDEMPDLDRLRFKIAEQTPQMAATK